MKIEISGQTVELKQSFRSYITFENVAEKPFGISGLQDLILFFYCTVMASKRDMDLDFDAFIDWLDERPEALSDFTKWTAETDKAQLALSRKAADGEQPADADGSKKKE